MKNGLKKYAKGMFAIFTIKLLLFGGVFIVQSCQNDGNIFVESEQELALKSFESLAKRTIPEANTVIENFKITKNNLKAAKSSISSKTNTDYDSFQNLEEIEAKTELEAQIILSPLVYSSINLLGTYGITEIDLIEEFGNINDPRIAAIGALVLAIEEEYNARLELSLNYSSLLGIQTANADAWGCFKRASGIAGIASIFRNGLRQTILVHGKRYVINIMSKALGRTLGWIGVGIAIYDFGRCMDWWVSGGSNPLNITDCNDLVRVSTIDWNYYEPFVYISKESIGYVSDSEYNINSVAEYDIYDISFSGGIGSDCSVTRTGRKITSRYFDTSSVQGYITLENDDLGGGK